jgi:hypothetical protein
MNITALSRNCVVLVACVVMHACADDAPSDVGSSSDTSASTSSTTVFISSTAVAPHTTSGDGIALDETVDGSTTAPDVDTTHTAVDSGTSSDPVLDCGVSEQNCGVNIEHDYQCMCNHEPVDPIDLNTCGCALLAGECVCPDVGNVPAYVCAWPCAWDFKVMQCMCGLELDVQAPVSYCV